MSFQQSTKSNFLTQIDFFKKTLESTPADKVDWKPDDTSMSPKDMVEHLAGANHYFAAMIKGVEPPAPPDEPPQFTLEQAMQFFDESCQMMAQTIESIPDDKLTDVRETPFGHSINVRYAMTIPASHIAYHWGQLSYLQKQYGDMEDHFLEPSFPMGKHYK